MFPACAVTSISAKSLFLFSLRLLSKIFSLFIEQNRSFPSFLVIIISVPSKLVKHNYLTVRRLFHERRTFSLPRLPPCGVPRCMGRSDGKRNAPCGFQTPCSLFPGLRRSGVTGRGAVRRRRQAASLMLCCGYGYGLAGLAHQTKYRGLFLLRKPCSHASSVLSVGMEKGQLISRLPLMGGLFSFTVCCSIIGVQFFKTCWWQTAF